MEQFLHVKRDWQKRMHKECIQNNKHKKNSNLQINQVYNKKNHFIKQLKKVKICFKHKKIYNNKEKEIYS